MVDLGYDLAILKKRLDVQAELFAKATGRVYKERLSQIRGHIEAYITRGYTLTPTNVQNFENHLKHMLELRARGGTIPEISEDGVYSALVGKPIHVHSKRYVGVSASHGELPSVSQRFAGKRYGRDEDSGGYRSVARKKAGID